MEKLLFNELRVLKSNMTKGGEIGEEGLKSALLDAKNLEALGFQLKKEGLSKLAAEYTSNTDLVPLFKRVQQFEPEIKVSPMYPGFPYQVLEMSEEEFRFHQHLHYLSTYGVEEVTGVSVKKGWVPYEADGVSKESSETKQIIELKVIDFLTEEEINKVVVDNLIAKKERLTPQELIIAKSVVEGENRPPITDIPFKENIVSLYKDLIVSRDKNTRDFAQMELSSILKHPGDVLDLLEGVVIANKYKHLRTSVKRVFVEMLEMFGLDALEENLANNRWSNSFLGKGGKARSINRNIALIDYLSYNRISKNEEAKSIVDDLKDGFLTSWNQEVENAYENEDFDEVRALLKQRPGMYFRQINRLIKLGVGGDEVLEDLIPLAGKLKTQSIISALNNYKGSREKFAESSELAAINTFCDHEEVVIAIFYSLLKNNLDSKEISALNNKKVYIEEGEFDLSSSRIEITDKFEGGGYIQSGVAIALPKEVDIVRFFTYWNDEERVDIDLHGSILKEEGVEHVGWYGGYNVDGVATSGDLVHSDSAEYIDVDLNKAAEAGIERVQFNIDSYTRQKFSEIEVLFTGLMAVNEVKEKVGQEEGDYSALFDSKNVFFRHDLDFDYTGVEYAYLHVPTRTLRILGRPTQEANSGHKMRLTRDTLTLDTYLAILLETQNAELVEKSEDADVILGLPKKDFEGEGKYYSLIDENYFL